MKRHALLSLATGVLTVLLAVGSVFAAEYAVSAKGKDVGVAETNAKVNAVRTCMKELVSEAFLQTNAKAIRAGVILKSDDFVTSCNIVESKQSDKLFTVQAVVDVDTERLKAALSAMQMDDASTQKMAVAQTAEVPASSPATASAKAAAPASSADIPDSLASDAATAVDASTSSVPAVPADTAEPTTPSAAGEAENVRMECFIDSTRETAAKLVPTSLFGLMDEEDAHFAEMLMAMDVQNLYMLYDEHKDSMVVMAGSLPSAGDRLRQLETSGISKREFAEMLGMTPERFPERMRTGLDETRSAPSQVAGVHQLGETYLAVADTVLVVGQNPRHVGEARERIMKDGHLFAVPANEQVWAKVTTRLDTAGQDKQARPYEQWFSLKAIPEGWACTTDSNADDLRPELASMPSLPLADTVLYGSTPPSLMLLWSGKLLQSLQTFTATLDGDAEAALSSFAVDFAALDSINFSLGASSANVMGMQLPGLSFCFTGEDKALTTLADKAKALIDGQWSEVPTQGWSSVLVSKQSTAAGSPMPMTVVLATRERTLLIALMQPDGFPGKDGNIAGFLNETYASGAEGLSFPADGMSGLYVVDVRKLWREAGELLAPTSPLRMLSGLDQKLDPATRAAFERLRTLTPPLRAMIGWSNAPRAASGQGYILLSKEDSSEFSKALADVVKALNKDKATP